MTTFRQIKNALVTTGFKLADHIMHLDPDERGMTRVTCVIYKDGNMTQEIGVIHVPILVIAGNINSGLIAMDRLKDAPPTVMDIDVDESLAKYRAHKARGSAQQSDIAGRPTYEEVLRKEDEASNPQP